MKYTASGSRYNTMKYNKCGESGLKLPTVSLGLWHNFGATDNFENMKEMFFTAFDNGITHFDIANNYGFPAVHHRPDPETPLEETMGALNQAVKSGKALYVGLSNYDVDEMVQAIKILHDLNCPFVINQNRYSIFDRILREKVFWIWQNRNEKELLFLAR